jgi:hypothetical protein
VKRRAPIIIACVCSLGFALGLLQLFKLRFEQGDVYPPYSSLRADPLGTMALYESLGRMPGVNVSRDFSARNQLPGQAHTTYLHLAAAPGDWHLVPDNSAREIESFLRRGGRLVIACEPETGDHKYFTHAGIESETTNVPPKKFGSKAPPSPSPKPHKSDKDAGDDDRPAKKFADLHDRWGFGVAYERLGSAADGQTAAVTVSNRFVPLLPPSLAWHSATIFTNLATEWKVLYARGTNAVLMERPFGRGSVVLASDSFFVSNEALLLDRHPDLLSWLIGPNQLVVFDEAHFGVVEEPGVATLMRRYRLHGFIAGLAAILGLFIWKSSFSLVPPAQAAPGPHVVSGRDSASGFVNLLRRSIPPGDVLKVCYEQWEKTAATRSELAPSRVTEAKLAVTAEEARSVMERNPVAAYQRVARILKSGGAASTGSQGPERDR